ncbi:MAG: HAD family phosphatase [Candidatus Nanohaloarchaea archaeon]|nr:HAD family phosphatase [Candidatus Nanohaloarchaea archaeon]
MVEAVIFDMDGVLVDSEPVHRRTLKEALKDNGVDISEEEIERHTGQPVKDILEIVKEERDADFDVDKVARQKTDRYIENLSDLKPVKGSVEIVKELYGSLKLALASSGMREVVEGVISELGIGRYLDAVVAFEDVERHKPDPEVFLKAADILGVKPENALVVEDSEKGVEAALKGGFKVVGFESNHDLDLSRADVVVDSMEELLEEIQNIEDKKR